MLASINNPRNLRIFYMLALGVLAALSVTTHYVLDSLNKAIESDGKVINVAGRQRMLSQRIASFSLQLLTASAGNDPAEIRAIRDELNRSVDLWLDSHKALISRNGAMSLEGANLLEEQIALEALTGDLEEIRSLVNQLYASIDSQATISQDSSFYVAQQIVQYTNILLPLLNDNVSLFEENLSVRISKMRRAETMAYCSTLVVLLLVAIFMFEPAIRRIRRQHMDIETMRATINTHTIYSVTDPLGRIIEVSQGFCRISGYDEDELIGQNHRLLNSGHHPKEFWHDMWRTISAGDVWRAEICNRAKDGSLYWVGSTNVPQVGPDGTIERFISWRFDITEQKRAQEEARRATEEATLVTERLEHGLSNSGTGLWDMDVPTKTTYYNDTWYTMLGYEPGELPMTTETWAKLVHPEDLDGASEALEMHLSGRRSDYHTSIRMRRKQGDWQWIRTVGKITEYAEDGTPLRMIGVHVDIQALRDAVSRAEQMNKAMQETQTRFELALEGSQDAIFDWNLATGELYLSPRWRNFLKDQDLDLNTGHSPLIDRVVSSELPRVQQEFADFLRSDSKQFESEFQMEASGGELISVLTRAAGVRDEHGRITRISGSSTDITSLKAAEKELKRLVQTDHLTGLASRSRFQERLDDALIRSKRNKQPIAVLFFDFDRFKSVNDTLGHEVGDELLCSIAERLRDNIRETDTAARFGGDEFVILLENLASSDHAPEVAQNLLLACAAAHDIRGNTLVSTASIGLITNEAGDYDSTELIKFADAAMYQAKKSGRGCVVEFDQTMFDIQIEQHSIEEDLVHATERNELMLSYQPIIDLENGRTAAAEALLRWHHPTKGLIRPDKFIPVAEETKQIVPIGARVIAMACEQLSSWRRRGIVDETFAVSVNVSKVQLLNPNFCESLLRQIDRNKLPRNLVKLEVTETTIVDNRTDVQEVLSSLREESIVVMMDDFGTGHSSLSGLHSLPVDELKIDQSFIKNASGNMDLVAITSSIVTLAEHLSLGTVGEGIETPEEIALLQSMGCRYGQGYFWSKPLPPDEFEERQQSKKVALKSA